MEKGFWKRQPRRVNQRDQAAMDVAKLIREREVTPLRNALGVMVKTPEIRAFLEQNDPMALRQALRALGEEPEGEKVAGQPDDLPT